MIFDLQRISNLENKMEISSFNRRSFNFMQYVKIRIYLSY